MRSSIDFVWVVAGGLGQKGWRASLLACGWASSQAGQGEAGAGAGNGAGFGKSTPEQLQTLFNNRLSKGQICDQGHLSTQLKSQHLWKT